MEIQETWQKPIDLAENSFEQQALYRADALSIAARLVLNATPESMTEAANELRGMLEEYDHCILKADDSWYHIKEEK